MKIKTTKQMRLDELIKYVWENPVLEKRVFIGSDDRRVVRVVFDKAGGFYPSGYCYGINSLFTVEVEEDLTEETEIDGFVVLTEANLIRPFNNIHTIGEVKAMLDSYETVKEIHAIINNKLTLIWSKDTGIPAEGVIEV